MRVSICLVTVGCLFAACAHTPSRVNEPAIDGSVAPFSTHHETGVRGQDADASLTRLIADECKAQDLIVDGRLSRVAEGVAKGSHGAERAPSYAQVTYFAQEAGLVEPTPEIWVASAGDAGQLAPSISDAMREAASKTKLSHCGGAVVREGPRLVVALAWSARFIDLAEEVPAQVAFGDSIKLRGSLLGGLQNPVLAITEPEGHVSRLALGKGKNIEREVTLDKRGVYAIEILGEGPGGVTVVANFPVAAGVPLDRKTPSSDDAPTERSAKEVVASLMRLIAEERQSRKLPPLKLEIRLSQIAERHSQDMLAHGFIAHTSPYTGEASDRVMRAGLVTTLVLENIGRGYSGAEIHQGLMESPGHRGNILHPDARELGIGVVIEPEGDRLAFLATELFTKLSRDIDIAQAPSIIADEVMNQRRLKRLKPITLDAGLAKVAQAAAEKLAADPLLDQNDLLDEATENVKRAPKGAHAIGAALLMAADIDQINESKRFLDPKLAFLGIGVARSKTLTAAPLIVVLVFGTVK